MVLMVLRTSYTGCLVYTQCSAMMCVHQHVVKKLEYFVIEKKSKEKRKFLVSLRGYYHHERYKLVILRLILVRGCGGKFTLPPSKSYTTFSIFTFKTISPSVSPGRILYLHRQGLGVGEGGYVRDVDSIAKKLRGACLPLRLIDVHAFCPGPVPPIRPLGCVQGRGQMYNNVV